jgi:hypothetical protein
LLAAVLTSCGDPEDAIFKGEPGQQTLVTMHSTTQDLPVVIEDQGSIEVQVDVTTKSNSDRTYDIVQVDSLTDVSPNLDYEFDQTVTIPAGKFIGTFTVSGFDDGLENETSKIGLRIEAQETSGLILENNTVSITAFRTCPVPEDFLVGTYVVADVVSGFSTFGGGQEVEISIPEDNPLQRVFTVEYLPGQGFGLTDYDVKLNLVCGFFSWAGVDEIPLQCDGETLIAFGPLADNTEGGAYNAQNEQNSYTVNYIEDVNGSCGAATQGSFSLTKVN